MKNYIAKNLANLDKGLLFLLILPWLLLINNDGWLFDHKRIDPWLYLGFFLRFKQLLEVHGDSYYASRLGWTVPGHIAFGIFPPLVAQYLLHVGFYYLAVISIYLLLKQTVSYRSALLASVMMGCHSWFLLAIGSNYVNGAGIAYYSAAAFMLVSATQKARWRVFLFLGGVFYGLAIYSNLSWLFFAPSLIFYYFYYLLVDFRSRKKIVISSGIFFILGLIAITVCLGAVSFTANGKFLFFLPSLNYLTSYAASPEVNPYKISWDIWLPSAFWLMFMTITFVSGTVLILLAWLKKIPPIQSVTFGFQIAFLLSALPFILAELKDQPMLQISHYASYLIPSTFIAIGGQLFQLESILNHLKRYQFWLIVSLTVLLVFVTYQSSIKPFVTLAPQNQADLITLFFAALWVILLSSALLSRHQVRKILSCVLLILLLSFNVMNFVSMAFVYYPILAPGGSALNSALKKGNFSQLRHDAFILTVDAQKYLKTVDPQVQLLFWYDLNEQWMYRSIAQSCLCQILTDEFPRTGAELDAAGKIANVMGRKHPNLVILSQKPDAFQQAKRSLNEIGFNADLVSTHDMKQGDLSFRMTFIDTYK